MKVPNVFPGQRPFCSLLQGLVWALVLLFILSCGKNENDKEPTSPGEDDTTNSQPTFQMPRPRDWAIGTWIGTIPAPSNWAGKKIRITITKECGTVTGSVVGYYYEGIFTWDYEGTSPGTVTFHLPQSGSDNYLWWVYDPSWDIETFRCEISYGSDHIVLSTTMLGDKNTTPTTINLYFSATIGGISEVDLVTIPFQKQ